MQTTLLNWLRWLASKSAGPSFWTLSSAGYLWAILVLFYLNDVPAWLNVLLSGSLAAGVPILMRRARDRMTAIRWGTAVWLVVLLVWYEVRPINQRDWSPHHTVQTKVKVDGDQVTLKDLRAFRHTGANRFQPEYFDETFDLEKIDSVWFGLQNFSSFQGFAHVFLSFGFCDDSGQIDYLAVSVEIRCEKGEQFSPLAGLFRRFEITYVLGEERDVIGWRSHFLKHKIRLYPVDATKSQMQSLFRDIVNRTERLRTHPEFYNTLTNNCANNLVSHVRSIEPEALSAYRMQVALPGYSDRMLFDKGLLKTDLSFEKSRERFLIRPRAEDYVRDNKGRITGLAKSFSKNIRRRDTP